MSNSKLYIGNLSYDVTSSDLSNFLSENWTVVDCKVIEGKGFAFVTFEDLNSANDAKEKLNDTEFHGRKLKIDNARENVGGGGGQRRDNRDRRPSYGGAGGGGGGGFKKRY
jgi:RNA recognition motif-containing protein